MKIEFDLRNNLIMATKFGPSSYLETIEFINKAIALGNKHKCYHILFNMQKTEETFSFMEGYDLNKNLLKVTDLTHKHRCALIYSGNSRDINKIKFKETVAGNWGQDIYKIFYNVDEGINWLKQLAANA
jgi:hypothetical protein